MDSFEKFDQMELPTKDQFYSVLNDQHITDDEYDHAKKVWKTFKIKTMGEYHDLCLGSDVLLLTDVFENFRKTCMQYYKLDPCHYFTSPGLSWDAMLKMTNIKLELMTDIDMYQFIKKGMRGGVSYIANRYGKANNKYRKEYNEKAPSKYIMYLDANNLYGWAMSQHLPTGNFKWMTDKEIKRIDLGKYKADGKKGLVLEVDLEYSQELHDLHNDYPLAPEKTKVSSGMLSEYCKKIADKYKISIGLVNKLISTLRDKKEYVLHYRNLQLYLDLVVYDENIATEQLNRDLKIIADWAYQWKMQFNPDITKQAIQVIFSQKRDKPIHPPIYFNESEVVIKHEQKHLGLILDSSLNFQSHVREKIVSARRGIGVIRYMSRYVTRDVLDQMYKLYIRPHLDYGDIIYHKYDPEMNLDFTKKLEATQYTAALAVSGAWRGTNKYKLYEELGWESLYHRRWYRRLTHFFKLKNRCSPLYLYDLIPPEREIHYDLRAPRDYVPQIERTVRFSNTYFQNCIHEWNLLDVSTRSIQSISQFKTELLGRIRPPKRPTFNIYDIEGIKLLTRLRVEFSDLRNHRYRHNFHCPNPTCLCQTGIENNEHFLLHCPRFSSQRRVLLDLVSKSVNFDILRLSSKELCNLLLYGHSKCTIITNRVIIESTLEYIKSTGRFKKK